MPVSFRARPYLALCIAFAIKKCVFRAFGPIVFFSECVFAIATKVPLRQYVKLFVKKRENHGGSCAGSGQTCPAFCFEAKLCSRSPLELGKILPKTIEKIRVICRKT